MPCDEWRPKLAPIISSGALTPLEDSDLASEYRYHPLGISTLCKTHELEYNFNTEYRYPSLSIDTMLSFETPPEFQNGEYRYPKSSIDTLSCRSAFNAGRKLPNGSIDDLTYQNGWKSVRGYKNKLLKLQQQQENYPRAKIKFKSSFELNLQTLVTQVVIFIPIHCLGCVSLIWAKIYPL
ncbi:hypothetical protein GQ457_08G036270 [Hibiscus cannabinus]